MRRILIANIFGIGDVIFTTPLVENLKKEMPRLEIGYLCNARTKDLLEEDPDIDYIHVYEKDDFVRAWGSSKKLFFSDLLGLFRGIREKRYDAVIDLTLSRKFSVLFILAGIKKRIGLDYKKRGIFLTHKIKFQGFSGKHVVEHYLDLLSLLGIKPSIKETEIVPDETLRGWASEYLEERGLKCGSFVAVVPGGGASWGPHAFRKRWNAAGFAKAADILTGRGFPVGILGGVQEKDLLEEVSGKMKQRPVFIESGLDLKKYTALLSCASMVLCNDGGPLHMAVALGVSTVSIFGPVDERIYGPYPPSPEHKVITADDVKCRPCYNRFKLPECAYDHKCITGIDPARVARACLEVLGVK